MKVGVNVISRFETDEPSSKGLKDPKGKRVEKTKRKKEIEEGSVVHIGPNDTRTAKIKKRRERRVHGHALCGHGAGGGTGMESVIAIRDSFNFEVVTNKQKSCLVDLVQSDRASRGKRAALGPSPAAATNAGG